MTASNAHALAAVMKAGPPQLAVVPSALLAVPGASAYYAGGAVIYTLARKRGIKTAWDRTCCSRWR